METPERPDNHREALKRILAPEYDPADQFTVEQLKTEYSDWTKHYNGDAELTAINVERQRYFKTLATEFGTSLNRTGGLGLVWAIEHIDPRIGGKFDAHGIKGKFDAIAELDTLLTKGVRKDKMFYTMWFGEDTQTDGMGAKHPSIEGGFIVVGAYGTKISESGIRYVVVGEEYNRVLDILKRRYPHFEFVPWQDAPRILTEAANRATGQTVAFQVLTPDNHPALMVKASGQKRINDMPIPPPLPEGPRVIPPEDPW